MSTPAIANIAAAIESSITVGVPTEKKAFKMYRHGSSNDRSLVLCDYTVIKNKESTIDFLTRIENNAGELSKRIYGSILFTRCRSVAAHYAVIDTDADGFVTKRIVDVEACSSAVPDMRQHPNFPKALLLRLAADARQNAESRVVSLHIRYNNCKPKADGAPILTAAAE